MKRKEELVEMKGKVKKCELGSGLLELCGGWCGCGESGYVKVICELLGEGEMVGKGRGCCCM